MFWEGERGRKEKRGPGVGRWAAPTLRRWEQRSGAAALGPGPGPGSARSRREAPPLFSDPGSWCFPDPGGPNPLRGSAGAAGSAPAHPSSRSGTGCSREATGSGADTGRAWEPAEMSTKAPIYLKRGSRKGKKEKLRDILSSDMISPPLGDFRHTIHIGSAGQGDTFGDISFLQGKLHLLPRPQPSFSFSRTSTVSGHEVPAPGSPSPLLKNAISLPTIGGPQAITLPSAPAPPKPPRLHLEDLGKRDEDEESGTIPPNGFTPEEEPGSAEPFLSHAGSLLSLHVDLGPSILEDVLQVMEKHQAEAGGGAPPASGLQESLT
ncbi:cdc42 effector protein 2 isoform X3 [Strigops habroptila]|uniref:CDC42 effector protein 2 n=1 Tax=Strigops habroptila TaxID=2489341 RepID=A0A672V673_STRHB|nr:cdc42 effector protein 2 isoform X3 [Strigops habroptila]